MPPAAIDGVNDNVRGILVSQGEIAVRDGIRNDIEFAWYVEHSEVYVGDYADVSCIYKDGVVVGEAS